MTEQTQVWNEQPGLIIGLAVSKGTDYGKWQRWGD